MNWWIYKTSDNSEKHMFSEPNMIYPPTGEAGARDGVVAWKSVWTIIWLIVSALVSSLFFPTLLATAH